MQQARTQVEEPNQSNPNAAPTSQNTFLGGSFDSQQRMKEIQARHAQQNKPASKIQVKKAQSTALGPKKGFIIGQG